MKEVSRPMDQETIWFWCRGFYKVYVDDYKLKIKIERWKEARLHCHYFYADGRRAYDFIIPSKLHSRARRLLGLNPEPKSINRVQAGKKAQERNLPYRFAEMKF